MICNKRQQQSHVLYSLPSCRASDNICFGSEQFAFSSLMIKFLAFPGVPFFFSCCFVGVSGSKEMKNKKKLSILKAKSKMEIR